MLKDVINRVKVELDSEKKNRSDYNANNFSNIINIY